MLTVEIGYVKFIFPEHESVAAFTFAKDARDHIDPDEHKSVVIRFEDKEEKES